MPKTLYLSDLFKYLNDFGESSLEQLEELDLSDPKITFSQLVFSILNKTTNLKNLQLAELDHLGELANFNLNLLSIVDLTLRGVSLSAEQFAVLVNSAPYLKSLSLRGWNHLDAATNMHIDLGMLEELLISNADADFRIVSKATNLKKLLIRDSGERHLLVSNLNLNSKNLEELDIQNTHIPFTVLAEGLNKVPNLKKLSLWYCEDLGHETSDVDLKNLEELDILMTELTFEQFAAIASKSCNLKVQFAKPLYISPISRKVLAKILLAFPNIVFDKESLLVSLSTEPKNDKLDEAIALHLMYKHKLTPDEQKLIIAKIKSPFLKTLLADKFATARIMLVQDPMMRDYLARAAELVYHEREYMPGQYFPANEFGYMGSLSGEVGSLDNNDAINLTIEELYDFRNHTKQTRYTHDTIYDACWKVSYSVRAYFMFINIIESIDISHLSTEEKKKLLKSFMKDLESNIKNPYLINTQEFQTKLRRSLPQDISPAPLRLLQKNIRKVISSFAAPSHDASLPRRSKPKNL